MRCYIGGPADTVGVYDEGCALVEAYVRAAFWDKAPNWNGTDPADLERPYVEVSVPTDGEFHLSLNPGQARDLAAALLRAADTADTAHTFARTDRTSGPPLTQHSYINCDIQPYLSPAAGVTCCRGRCCQR